MAQRTKSIPKLSASAVAHTNGKQLPPEKAAAPVVKGGGLHAQIQHEMTTGEVSTVPVRVKRVLDQAFPGSNETGLVPIRPGEVRSQTPPHTGRTLMNEIRLCLKERATIKKKDGKMVTSDRFHGVAEAFALKLEAGEFPFHKEFIEREEGKVPVRVDQNVNQHVKIYAGMPLEGPNAP